MKIVSAISIAFVVLVGAVALTAGGSDDDVHVESRVKNAAPEASGVSDALSKADCDVFDFLDDPDLRYLRYVLDLLDRSDLLDLDDDLYLDLDDRLSQDLIDLYNVLDILDSGALVDTLNGSDLRDLLDRLGRRDLLDLFDRLDDLDIYGQDLLDARYILGFYGIVDVLDDLRDGLRGVLDQCAATSDSGADAPEGDDVDGG